MSMYLHYINVGNIFIFFYVFIIRNDLRFWDIRNNG